MIKVKIDPIVIGQRGHAVPAKRAVQVDTAKVVMIHVDLDKKNYWDIFGIGGDGDIPEISLHPHIREDLNEDYDHEKIVNITFPTFVGWSFWAVQMHNDYISIAFYRTTKE
jgi:hypothetical protein